MLKTCNYFSSPLDNYFTLPFRKVKKGVYLLRLYIWWPDVTNQEQDMVAGLYSAATFGVKEVTQDINDMEFMEQNCHSHARLNKTKEYLKDDPNSWVAKSLLSDTNYGYVVFHFGSKSELKSYKWKFDET